MSPSSIRTTFILLAMLLATTHAPAYETVSLSDDEQRYVAENSPFTLCVDPAFMPFEQIDVNGQHAGLFADFLARVTENSGVRFKLVPTPYYAQSWKRFTARQCDLITSTKTPVVSGEYLATQSFFSSEMGYAVSTHNSDDFTVLSRQRVGVVSGTNVDVLKKMYPGLDISEVDSIRTGLEGIVSGDWNTFIAPLEILRYQLKLLGMEQLKIGGALGGYSYYKLLVNESRSPLLPVLNKAISAISERERANLVHQWLHVGVIEHETSHYVMGLFVAALLLLVLLYRYRHLWQRSQQLQETLTDSEKRFERLADNAPDMLFRMTLPEGVYEYVSPAAMDIFGYTPEEFLATPQLVAKLTHNEWSDYVSERWSCAIAGDAPSGCEFQVVHKSGELRWLSQRCTIIKDEQGTALAMEGIISDITERKQIDAALQESKVRYRNLLDSSPDWIWEVDANAVYTYASPKVEELLGYTPDELIGKTPFDLMPPSEVDRVSAAYSEIVAAKRAFNNLENINRHKDGQLVVLETSGTPIISAEGELLGYRGVDRDITQRKHNEHELRVERDFNSTVVESAGNAIVVLDMLGNFVRFNRAAEELTGYSRDEMIGHPVWERVIPPEQRAAVRGVFDTLREGKIDMAGQYENEWLTRDGGRRLLHWHNSVLRDEDGNISNIVALGYDITEQKKLENTLREQERELAQIIDHIPNMIFLKEASDLRYVRFNTAGEQLTGVSRQDIIGKNDHDFFPAEQADFFNERDRAVLASKEMEDIPEEPIDTPHGTRTLHTRKVAIRDENGKAKYLLGISDDITERKGEELERERLQRELQQAQKMESLGQLTGGIAHDFNNLLGIINGYAGLALDNCLNRGEDKLADYMRHLKEAGDRATSLVSQMLAFSRSDQAEDAAVELAPLLKEDIKMLRSTLPSTIEMVSEIEPGLPPVVMNPTQLHQILMNLSINGRDAMKGDGTLTIRLGWARGLDTESPISHKPVKGDWIELSVSDTGSGIDEETAKSIFNPFFTTKEVGKGTGMGLAVIYGIMDNHQGHILLESEEGRGSTFRMLFKPYLDEQLASRKQGELVAALEHGDGSEILVVDDELSLGIFMAELLKSYGYRATSVADSAEALELFTQEPERFAMLITDQTMPHLTGTELIEATRRLRPQLSAILCTGYSDKVDAKGAAEMDILFFEKPVDEQKLIMNIAELLKASRDNVDGEA